MPWTSRLRACRRPERQAISPTNIPARGQQCGLGDVPFDRADAQLVSLRDLPIAHSVDPGARTKSHVLAFCLPRHSLKCATRSRASTTASAVGFGVDECAAWGVARVRMAIWQAESHDANGRVRGERHFVKPSRSHKARVEEAGEWLFNQPRTSLDATSGR